MGAVSELRAAEHRLTRRMAGWDSFWTRRLLPAVEDAAQHTKLWWGIALLLAVTGGRRGRRAAAAGLTGMAVAEVLSNGVGKRLVPRERPPKEWFHADEVEDRPDSSSFPSGHTAAAVAFTAASPRSGRKPVRCAWRWPSPSPSNGSTAGPTTPATWRRARSSGQSPGPCPTPLPRPCAVCGGSSRRRPRPFVSGRGGRGARDGRRRLPR
nr:phosphatase PAP2 family protein [Streptomyces sp. NBC_00667]